MTNPGKLFLIAAPSGTGKTTIATKIVERLGKEIAISRVITYTTRQKRDGEIDGIDYFFLDKTTFLKKIAQAFFLEMTNYNGELYGSPLAMLDDMKAGKSFVMVTDRAGVVSLKALVPEAISIWVSPPSLQELEQRLIGRGTESSSEIKKRLLIAQHEMDLERKDPIFELHITNKILETVVDSICNLIQTRLKNTSIAAHHDKKDTDQE